MGYRVKGVLLSSEPDRARLTGIGKTFGYRLFLVKASQKWLLDLGVAEPKRWDAGLFKAARPLAPEYVDAVRILHPADIAVDQLPWLTATSYVARELGQSVLGFVSDDDLRDFAAVAEPAGMTCVTDKVDPFILRWDRGALSLQGYISDDPWSSPPQTPHELLSIAGVTVLPPEELPGGGYPLYGNVAAEMQAVAPGVAEALGLYSWDGPPHGSLTLVNWVRLDRSQWDYAAGVRED